MSNESASPTLRRWCPSSSPGDLRLLLRVGLFDHRARRGRSRVAIDDAADERMVRNQVFFPALPDAGRTGVTALLSYRAGRKRPSGLVPRSRRGLVGVSSSRDRERPMNNGLADGSSRVAAEAEVVWRDYSD